MSSIKSEQQLKHEFNQKRVWQYLRKTLLSFPIYFEDFLFHFATARRRIPLATVWLAGNISTAAAVWSLSLTKLLKNPHKFACRKWGALWLYYLKKLEDASLKLRLFVPGKIDRLHADFGRILVGLRGIIPSKHLSFEPWIWKERLRCIRNNALGGCVHLKLNILHWIVTNNS